MTAPQNLLQWIELSKENLLYNVKLIRSMCSKEIEIAALLKANAYGHGILEMARLYKTSGINIFMVHSFQEAMILYKNGYNKRIVVIGPLNENQLFLSLKHGFEITVYTIETLNLIHKIQKKVNKTAKLHIKIETGTYRQGLSINDISDFVKTLKYIKKYDLKGISSHFANIEDTSQASFYKKQLRIFKKAITLFQNYKLSPKAKHIACSAAVLLYPETHFQIIRPGIALYGYYSSLELAYALNHSNPLKPVLSWKTRICQIKNVKKGEGIGYGLTYKTTHKIRLGVLPIGYYDGYDRKLSNIGICLVNGKRAFVRGRVCMNMIMIDLTDIPESKVGDIVTLIGCDQNEKITADDLAIQTNTISYEILARLNPNIPKFIV